MNTHDEYEQLSNVIKKFDPWCRGIVLLGLAAPLEDLVAGFKTATAHPLVKGFAVGRSIWYAAAEQWLCSEIGDDEFITRVRDRFALLARTWDDARVPEKRIGNA